MLIGRMALFQPLRRHLRRLLRVRLRGYRYLQKVGKQSLIYDIKGALRACKLVIPNDRFSKAIFGAAFENAELVVRQRLSSREGSVTRALLLAAGRKESRVTLPLPPEWLRAVESFGFLTNRYKSFLFLYSKALQDLFFGALQVIINLKNNFSFSKRSTLPIEKFIYFCDLVDTNLPQPVGNKGSYCVINWYLQWQGKRTDLRVIAHGVADYSGSHIEDTRLVYRKSPLPDLVGALPLIKYVFWAFKAISISAYDLLCGRWWHAMLLREASFAAMVRCGDAETLARQYFFNNSRFYPPLWTTELQTLGSEVIHYWYSTNIEPLMRPNGSRPLNSYYSLSNWPRHLVWDEAQANFVRHCQENGAIIEVVGPIWFQDNGEEPPIFFKPVVAVFDVQPVRESFFRSLAPYSDFYTSQNSIAFFNDILAEIPANKFSIIVKPKREIGSQLHPRYREFLKSFTSCRRIYVVDSGISAFRVIERADAVISRPFTSTALIAKSLGKPSVYFDPTATQVLNRISAGGLEVLRNRLELRHWIERLKF